MTTTSEPRDPGRWGTWATSVNQLVTYSYVGCRSSVVDLDHAIGHTTLRHDMRLGAGLRGAPLTISMLDTAGINIDGRWFGALSHVGLQVVDDGAGVDRIRTDGAVARIARTQLFTEAVISDAGDPQRVVALGTAEWGNLGPVPDGWTYTDPGPGIPDRPDLPPMTGAFLVERDGDAYVVPRLGDTIGTEILHHGPILVSLDAATADLAATRVDPGRLVLRSWDVRFIRAGRTPPFVTRERLVRDSATAVAVRTDLVDGAGAVIASAGVTFDVRA